MRPNRAIDFCKITKIEDKLPFLPKQDWYKADWHRTARSADLVPELRNTNSQTQVLKIVSFSSYLNSVSLCDLLLILCFLNWQYYKKICKLRAFLRFFWCFLPSSKPNSLIYLQLCFCLLSSFFSCCYTEKIVSWFHFFNSLFHFTNY